MRSAVGPAVAGVAVRPEAAVRGRLRAERVAVAEE
jgi:hypothetical protein